MKVDVGAFAVTAGSRDPLAASASDTKPFRSKQDAEEYLEKQLARLLDLQGQLYADGRYALLLVLQGMDGSGKDSLIGHVMRGLNPQGTSVTSFKVPSDEEVAHDFLWRAVKALPRKGQIAVFNRSYYEEVIVVRVHPEVLERQKLPQPPGTRFWHERFEDIRCFEQHLDRSGTIVCKIFLHLSKEEQQRRLLARLTDSSKNWKFSAAELAERERWHDYAQAYRSALAATSTPRAPWYVVPADHKWFVRAVVARILVETLEALDLQYPKLPASQVAAMERAVADLKGRLPATGRAPSRRRKHAR